MDDQALLRYSRQIMLPEIDIEGQQKLADAQVLIIGMGGLGSPAGLYLAAAGVGHLVIVDFDRVELSNLQRQIAHRTADIGRAKVDSAAAAMAALNPLVNIETIAHELDDAELHQQVSAADVVVDACDNLSSRLAINRACVATQTALVSGAAIRMEGQVLVYSPEHLDAPCYRCLYRSDQDLDATCTQSGVIAPLLGIIGSVQATETLKLIIDIGETLTGRLLLLDAYRMEWHSVAIKKNPNCPVCSELKI